MLKRLRYYIVSAVMLLSMAQAMAQVAMPDTVCIGTSRIYQVNDATVRSTYTWKIDGVTQPSTTHQLSTTWNTAGTFLVSVQEHGENGCDGDIRTGLVIVRPIPIPNAGPDAIVCFGTSLRLNGSGGTVYQWSPGTYLSNPLIRDPLFTGTRAGVFTYLLAVTDDIGCKSSLRDTVVITVLPQARIFAGNDTSVSINQPLQLNAIDRSGSGFTSYSWSPSFGLSSSSVANPVALFNSISGNSGYNY
ncbi:MAG: hypothetical protein JNM19_04075, partial [Chitinophagaceae bacterium]|nr:hypothetical protein [Chitinophagaceae bacterium]